MVRELNIEAELTSSKDVYTGALSCYAENCLIEGVAARVNFLERAEGADKASAGLVGELGANGRIENAAVRLSGTEFSGFAGIASACYGRVANCSVTLISEAATFANFGGIVQAAMGGEIADCVFTMPAAGSFAAGFTVGGVVGNACGAKVVRCAAECNFTAYLPGTGQAGGIAGVVNACAPGDAANFSSTVIADCVSSGPQIAAGGRAGGIVGMVYGLAGLPVFITGCEARVAVIGAADAADVFNVGGLIGFVALTADVTVSGCASYGNVSGSAFVGGLLGQAGYANASAALALTVTDCHAYGDEVRAVKAGTNSYAGGFVGAVTGTAEARTSFNNCTAAPSVTAAGSCAGGFTGGHLVREAKRADAVYASCKAVGDVALTGGWNIPEYDQPHNGAAGGFIGYAATGSENLSFTDCAAAGSANGVYGDKSFHHVGGFIGYGYNAGGSMTNCSAAGYARGYGGVGGFAGRMELFRLTGCIARGDAYTHNGWSAGGFVGAGSGLTCENCAAYGNIAHNADNASGSNSGGFVGDCWNGGRYTACTAYGGVSNGGAYLGGFVGMVREVASGESISFSGCEAYGSVSANAALRVTTHGGFVGILSVNGSASFDRCVARGDVTGSRVGGFAGYIYTGEGASFTNCTAYGSAATNGSLADEAGGFIAYIQGVSGAVLRNCMAYGASVSVAPLNGEADSGGFIGALSTAADIQNCKAYCKQVVGDVGFTGGLIGSYYGNVNGSAANAIVKNNQCTLPGGIPVIGGRSYGMSASYPVTEQNNAGNLTAPAADPRPGLTVRAEKSGANGVKVLVAGFQNIAATDYVTDFAVSLDGGKTFTQYVYTSADGSISGAVLAAFTGAKDASGRLLAGDFSLELKNVTAYPAAGQIVVRVALSGGFAATKRL